MWVPDIAGASGPRYLALASAIADAINRGELPAGAQLPPQRDLAQKLGVTVATVGRAYNIIKRRELVCGEVGRGTFVRGREGRTRVANYLPERRSDMIDLIGMRVPTEEVAESVSQAMTEIAQQTVLLALSGYPPVAGYITHRAAGAAWIKRCGLDVPPERVMACSGAQQAIFCTLAALAHPGSPIVSETITYSGMKSIAALRGVAVEGVEVDEEGMIPDALSECLSKRGGRILFLQPTIHNPLGTSMPAARRQAIAAIARAHDLTIVEDDVAGAGLSDRPPPIAAYAPERTVYITGLSKAVCPALRVGFVAAPAAILERLSNMNYLLSLGASPITLEVASLMIMNGSCERIAALNRKDLARRHEIVRDELAGLDVRNNPEAFFAWLRLPRQWSSADYVEAARTSGVSLVGADNFHVGAGEAPRAVRLALNPAPSDETLIDGLRILRRLVDERPAPKLAVV